ncbi:MAG: LuxR family transcriptional regulator [Sulfobacillus benefaciens]|uniref:LuxR family transcriptional regulator n=1 Tax=Sulfobacillus benefaciens TaxID=453960 RepID=A0A2T2WGZ4_9FIRM|nr:MAG: LuxR family transcriptional regulator [Sulfobacillus benefaciens]
MDSARVYRRGILLRGLTGIFLLWIWQHFPRLAWGHAWLIGSFVLLVDGLATLFYYQWPPHLSWAIRGTLVADGILGLAAVWAFSRSATTNAPVLLLLVVIEALAYQSTPRKVYSTGIYLLGATGILGLIPGPHMALPLLPWSRVVFWMGVNGLLWGSLWVLLGLPLRASLPDMRLTPREHEVYQLHHMGCSAAEIATQLQIEVSTVKTHLHHIHHKLSN